MADWARAVQANHHELRCHWFRSPEVACTRASTLTKQLPLLEAEARSLQQQYIHWHCRSGQSRLTSHIKTTNSPCVNADVCVCFFL